VVRRGSEIVGGEGRGSSRNDTRGEEEGRERFGVCTRRQAEGVRVAVGSGWGAEGLKGLGDMSLVSV